MTVYSFNIMYENDDMIQRRYVVASSSEEALLKLEHYSEILQSEGFAKFNIISEPLAELNNVIC